MPGLDTPVTTIASLKQLLHGLHVGVPNSEGTSCDQCGRGLRDGDAVTVYASKPVEATTWKIRQINCQDCQQKMEISTPTLGVSEALAAANLGITQNAATQTTWLVLANVKPISFAPPDQCTEP